MAKAKPPRGGSDGSGRAIPDAGARPCRRCSIGRWCWASGGLIFVVAFFAVFAVDLPDTSKLYEVKRQPSVSYLDRSGALVAVRGSQYAPPVDLDKLPPYVPKAFIAIEDRWFYWHFGFNPWGIARSQIYNMTHKGRSLRGGSTITQQLARNLFLTPNQTYRRKAQELILAVWLEARFSKKQGARALSEPGLFRGRRLRHRGRLAALFRQAGAAAHSGRKRAPGRDDEGAVALLAGRRHRPRGAAGDHRARRDGRAALHHAGPA